MKSKALIKQCYFCGKNFDFLKEGLMLLVYKKRYYCCEKCQEQRYKATLNQIDFKTSMN